MEHLPHRVIIKFSPPCGVFKVGGVYHADLTSDLHTYGQGWLITVKDDEGSLQMFGDAYVVRVPANLQRD